MWIPRTPPTVRPRMATLRPGATPRRRCVPSGHRPPQDMAVAVPSAHNHDHRWRVGRLGGILAYLAFLALRGILDSVPERSGPATASYAPRRGLTEAPTVKEPAMTHPPPGNGPWHVLILDSDPAGRKWILATVARPEDVRPARPGAAAACPSPPSPPCQPSGAGG